MPETQFEKLKKLDEYAKSLGMTIYNLDYGFKKDNKECIHRMLVLNEYSDKYKDFLN